MSMIRILILVCLAPMIAQAAPNPQIRTLHQLVTDWQIDEARTLIKPLLASQPQDLHVRFVQARLLYFEARYADSARLLDEIVESYDDGDAPQAVVGLRDQVTATRDALKEFDEFVSPDKRFLIRYTGRDRLMIPYILDVLQRTDRVLSADFGYHPPEQVVVEIYPQIKFLAAVSPLTESEIETSGTIALCKYNRLMFTSPRALVRGYGWQDTVSHEFVHYFVTKASSNTVPIWLHEGIAKFQESRWRSEPGQKLDPPQEDLLARSLASDKLITFAQMHPSMAKLPSQEAASLAFAQVHTVIDFLHQRAGYEGLNRLLARLRAGDKMDLALRAAYGFDLGGLWTVWKREMKRRGFKTFPGLVQTSLKFKRPGTEGEEEADYSTISEKRVKDFTHLGELLRARNRMAASLAEYRKAMTAGGDGNPVIQNGAAAALIALEQFEEIPDTLERVLSYYPGLVRTHIHLGEAFLHLGRRAEAVTAFEAAVGINPFHPRPHQALATLYDEAGKTELADRERASLEVLNE